MNCPYCGAQVRDGAHFCGECGTDLSKAAQPTQRIAQGLQVPSQPTQAEPTQTLRDALGEREDQASPSAGQATQRIQLTYEPVAQTQRMPQAQPSPQAGQPTYQQPAQAPQQGHAQQPAQDYQQPQGQPSYQHPSQLPYQPQPVDPYQQAPQGYNGPVGTIQQPQARQGLPTWAKVALGVVGVAAVVGIVLALVGILSRPGAVSGDDDTDAPGGAISDNHPGTSHSDAAYTLDDEYVDETYGYSFRMPSDPTQTDYGEAGQVSLYWDDPDLWVNAYVGSNRSGSTPEEVGEFLAEQYDASIEELGSDYVIGLSTDGDGDTNYTLIYVTENNLQYLDVYYHPEDEDAMWPVAHELMESFSPGSGDSPEDDPNDDVPVEIGGELFDGVAEGERVSDATYGFSVTAVDGGFERMDVDEGALFLVHEDPSLYISCYGEDEGYESLELAYEALTSVAPSDVECSEATYDERAGSLTYTETSVDGVSLYKAYVGGDSLQLFVAMYDRGDEDAEALATAMAETFEPGA